MGDGVGVFRIFTICAIAWSLVLCNGCVSTVPPLDIKHTQYNYETVEALQVAREAYKGSRKDDTLRGFADIDTMSIHILKGDAWDMACWVRHEQRHLVAGSWHGMKSNSDCDTGGRDIYSTDWGANSDE
jgi:hypothetical protein